MRGKPADNLSTRGRPSAATALMVALAAVAVLAGCTEDSYFGGDNDGVEACENGKTRCRNEAVETCKDGSWKQTEVCTPGFQICSMVGSTAMCVANASCTDGKKNQSETDVDCGGGYCPACDTGKSCKNDSDCKSKVCVGGVCKVCRAGEGGCLGNFVRVCKPDHSGWKKIATCDPVKGEVCNPKTTSCEPSKPIGGPSATGKYYLYSMLKSGDSAFKGGYDVDSYVETIGDNEVNYLYVNRSTQLDVYKVKGIDSDGDGTFEPHQHPENPDKKGPVEERQLEFVKTYSNVKLGQPSVGEIYALKDRIMFLRREGTSYPGTYNLYEFVFATGKTNTLFKGNPKLPMCVLGYDKTNKRWYGGWNSSVRRVYALYPGQGGWAVEFDYPNLAGSHMDGLEVVFDPKKKVPYVYVSDMTSDFLAQYFYDTATRQWVQKNVFEYKETEMQYVEGMGFGAFQHFWATSGKAVYEVGGGDLQKYVGPQIE